VVAAGRGVDVVWLRPAGKATVVWNWCDHERTRTQRVSLGGSLGCLWGGHGDSSQVEVHNHTCIYMIVDPTSWNTIPHYELVDG